MHVVETDFEPDDGKGIKAYAARCDNVDVVFFVGESQPSHKIPYFTEFMNLITEAFPHAFASIRIFQGLGSDKGYPLCEPSTIEADSEATILKNYADVYAQEPSLAFVMKPPREAVALKLGCPKTNVQAYGSFNFHALKKSEEEIDAYMKRYRQFYYYDSFTAIGSRNVGMHTGDASKVDKFIGNMIFKWNTHIVEQCHTKLKTDTDEKSIARTMKIIENVGANIHQQFVMADVCLILCPLPTVRVKLESMKPYPVWVPSEDSNIYVFDDNKEERREDLIKQLEAMNDNN